MNGAGLCRSDLSGLAGAVVWIVETLTEPEPQAIVKIESKLDRAGWPVALTHHQHLRLATSGAHVTARGDHELEVGLDLVLTASKP